MGPLIQGYFSIESITVLHGLWLTWICMCGGLIISYTQINPHFVQGSTINIHIYQPPPNTHIHTHTKIEKYVWGLVYVYAFSSSVHWDGPKQWLSNRDEHPGSRSWFSNTIFLDMIDARSMASWMIHHSRGFPFSTWSFLLSPLQIYLLPSRCKADIPRSEFLKLWFFFIPLYNFFLSKPIHAWRYKSGTLEVFSFQLQFLIRAP